MFVGVPCLTLPTFYHYYDLLTPIDTTPIYLDDSFCLSPSIIHTHTPTITLLRLFYLPTYLYIRWGYVDSLPRVYVVITFEGFECEFVRYRSTAAFLADFTILPTLRAIYPLCRVDLFATCLRLRLIPFLPPLLIYLVVVDLHLTFAFCYHLCHLPPYLPACLPCLPATLVTFAFTFTCRLDYVYLPLHVTCDLRYYVLHTLPVYVVVPHLRCYVLPACLKMITVGPTLGAVQLLLLLIVCCVNLLLYLHDC